ncbi:cell wall arabinan synthesis protein [Gordonia neofelifaecis NRRL B-59395]|uniref:Cell wall arabinan synthesis protein n=1 Tax=Gordonia neofelifaecis NRRL B-59395 TaxID=644548 RepID=F1YP62_9ACTN|nr:cell wall arabinan synthesis protein [Gordonia neofelifaecis NRRL B-59395]
MSARGLAVIASVAGLIALAAAIATPFLPVDEQSSSFDWPRGQDLSADNASVTSPLVTQTARGLEVTISCRLLHDAGARNANTVIVATAPVTAPRDIRNTALAITSGPGGASVSVRNSVLTTADRAALEKCSELKFWATDADLGAEFVGALPPARGDPVDRPTVAGVFTDLTRDQVERAQPGLTAHVDVDNAFDVSRTWIKTAVIVIGVIAAIIALVALARLDAVSRFRGPAVRRRRFPGLLVPRLTDLAVTAALVVWHFLGAGTSDDGYVMVMGRNATDAGYLSDYYRYFGVPEAPFDWYYSFLSHWATISSAGVWMRLPALIAGLVSWFILSRVILPRLGSAVRSSQWAMFSGAAVFVAFWVAFCSGLRTEPIIVVGSLITWWLVETAIATRRLLPAALATFTALITLAAAPQGVIAVAVLIVGSRPMLRIVRTLRSQYGLLPLFAPLAASVSLVAFIVFRTQTFGGVVEAVRVRYIVGPTLSWYQELMRYYFLTLGTPDGALARRIPVLILIVSLGLIVAVMLRRGRLSGFARGPIWRLVGSVLVTIGLLSFVPMKWTVQFGVFAGVAAACAAVATAVVIRVGARSPRVLWSYVTVLLGACAIATAGDNAWGWAYDYGIPWFDKAPVLAGHPVSTLFLVLTGISFLILVWVSIRPHDARPPAPAALRRRRILAALPVLVIAAALVLAEFALFGKAAINRSDTYTALSANARALTGNTCGMADRVLVEPNPNTGTLSPIGTDDASKALAGESTGFTPDGVAGDLSPEPIRLGAGTIRTATPGRSYSGEGAPEGTTGGTGPKTINGSTVALPDAVRLPVSGPSRNVRCLRGTGQLRLRQRHREAHHRLVPTPRPHRLADHRDQCGGFDLLDRPGRRSDRRPRSARRVRDRRGRRVPARRGSGGPDRPGTRPSESALAQPSDPDDGGPGEGHGDAHRRRRLESQPRRVAGRHAATRTALEDPAVGGRQRVAGTAGPLGREPVPLPAADHRARRRLQRSAVADHARPCDDVLEVEELAGHVGGRHPRGLGVPDRAVDGGHVLGERLVSRLGQSVETRAVGARRARRASEHRNGPTARLAQPQHHRGGRHR